MTSATDPRSVVRSATLRFDRRFPSRGSPVRTSFRSRLASLAVAALAAGCTSSLCDRKPVAGSDTVEPSPAATAAAATATKNEVDVPPPTGAAHPASFHALSTTSLDGKPVDLGAFRGTVLLVVNTASQCGLTPQYAGLERMQGELAGKPFTVLGFPSNDFGGQEPGSPAEIRQFCTTEYGVTFPLFAKVRTKAGEGQSPIYAWLGERTGQLPRWNFGKYLIGKDGTTVQYFDSKVPPEDPALREAIDAALAK